MSKIINVNFCYKTSQVRCPFGMKQINGYRCMYPLKLPQRNIKDPLIIPEWCPLEDNKQNNSCECGAKNNISCTCR